MENEYGSDFMPIVDEDGTEYELEVLSSLDYNGYTYLAVIPAGGEDDEEFQVSILKSVEEDGEPILCAIEDETELEAVYGRALRRGRRVIFPAWCVLCPFGPTFYHWEARLPARFAGLPPTR